LNTRSAIDAVLPSFLRPIVTRVETSPLGYRLVRGAFWSFVGALISRGLTFLSSVLVARMLGREGFGQLGIIQNTVGMLGVFAGFGLGVTATKFIAELKNKDPEKAGRIMALSGVMAAGSGGCMAVMLYLFSPWLASHTLAAPHLSGLLQIGAGILFLSAMNGSQTGALAGFETFKTIAYVNLITGIVTFPLMVGGVYLAGIQGAVWALVLSMAINWLLNHLALRREAAKAGVPFVFKGSAQEWPVIYKFSFPVVLSGTMVGPISWACNAMLVNQPNGYAEMGTFNAAYIVYGVLFFLGTVVGTPLLPMISNEFNSYSKQLGRTNVLLSWSLGVIPALPLLSFPELVQMLYGNKFNDISFLHTLALILYFTCFVLYKDGLARVLAAKNLMWWGVLSNLLWGTVMLLSAYFLTPWGASGLAASFAIAYVINTIFFLPFYTKRGLVPLNTIISLDAGIIWFVLSVMVLMVLLNCTILERVVVFPLSFFLVLKSFWRLASYGLLNRL